MLRTILVCILSVCLIGLPLGCITTTTVGEDGTVTEQRRLDIEQVSLIMGLVTTEGLNLFIAIKELFRDDELSEAERELRLAEIQTRQDIINGIIVVATRIIIGELDELETEAAFADIEVGMKVLDLE